MNKAILLSIKPYLCHLIANGVKTIEIRKTKPKLKPPFKCYMYQTLPKYGDWNERDGRVIGEFICDYISKLLPVGDIVYCSEYKKSCLSVDKIKEYAKGKQLYGWHISNLKIYDKPKELSEFKRYNRTEENSPCAHTKWLYEPCDKCKECNLKRPPQNWCYVEEIIV